MWWKDVKLNVQPIFVNYSPYVTGGAAHSLSEKEVKDFVKKTMKEIEAELGHINLYQPLLVESLKDIENIKADISKDIDFLLPSIAGHLYKDGWRHSLPTELLLGDLNIPIIKVVLSAWDFLGLELVAALRDRNKKAYYAASFKKANEILRMHKIKKALRLSKCLIFGHLQNRFIPIQEGIATNIFDPILVKRKMGVELEYWTKDELASVVQQISVADAKEVANDWLKHAQNIKPVFREEEVNKEYIVNAARLYLAIKKAIDITNSTAVAGCGAAGQAIEPQSPPCISFTWLKDQGIPAGCEADMNATLAQIMLTYIAEAPVDMGNVIQHINFANAGDFNVPNPKNNTTILITHSVTPRKMKGFGTHPAGYDILGTHCSSCFAPNTFVKLDEGQVTTISRFSPGMKKLMLAKGVIVNSEITRAEGNREVAYIDVGRDAADFMCDLANYGNHQTYVYGDHIEDMKKLCDELDIETEVIT